MGNNIQRRYSKFAVASDHSTLLLCPVCSADLFLEGNSLVCANGHTFDISSKGSVDLRRKATHLDHYDAEFFEARRKAFEYGLYSQLSSELKNLIAGITSHGPNNPRAVILDAGCGEGYFSRILEATIGLDLSIDGIRVAARGGGSDCQWVCGDLANMPVRDECVDIILNIFSPAQYQQFRRVSPHGIVVKVIPGVHHMEELRALMGLGPSTDSSGSMELLGKNARILDTVDCLQTSEVEDIQHARLVAHMSPVAFDRQSVESRLGKLTSITTHSKIVLAKLL
jgi:23S rRNA (guanine745-N1)-methyltransferase